jgi:predicted  nucleic acid-binding Zn-ribbon protein
LLQVAAERARLEERIKVVSEEQDRIRKNMGYLDRNSDLYRRYVTKFGEQEDSVDKMHDQIMNLTNEEAHLRTSLDEYLMSLDV